MQTVEPFPVVARQELAFLVRDRGFVEVWCTDWTIRFESASNGVEAVLDPREGVELAAFRLGLESAVEPWRWIGMLGRASARRLVKIAAQDLQSDPAILLGADSRGHVVTTAAAWCSSFWRSRRWPVVA